MCRQIVGFNGGGEVRPLGLCFWQSAEKKSREKGHRRGHGRILETRKVSVESWEFLRRKGKARTKRSRGKSVWGVVAEQGERQVSQSRRAEANARNDSKKEEKNHPS